ncbi:MAG: hydantoinase B/oxoprolinase family protein, partial [Thermodesulfobacteriota bacterium]
SAVQTHMTNTLNTPIESLERELPVMLNSYSIRKNSGGQGKYRGGDSIVREYKFLSDTTVSMITERRKFAPYGIEGGGVGKKGKNTLIRKGTVSRIAPKASFKVKKGDSIRIETPAGGGWGKPK